MTVRRGRNAEAFLIAAGRAAQGEDAWITARHGSAGMGNPSQAGVSVAEEEKLLPSDHT